MHRRLLQTGCSCATGGNRCYRPVLRGRTQALVPGAGILVELGVFRRMQISIAGSIVHELEVL